MNVQYDTGEQMFDDKYRKDLNPDSFDYKQHFDRMNDDDTFQFDTVDNLSYRNGGDNELHPEVPADFTPE